MKKVILLTLFALVLLAFAGCNTSSGGGGETMPEPTEAPTAEVTKPTTVYTADSLEFDTFADMKKNVSLFKSQLPCTRSTKGYNAAGDGGAAKYSLTATQPTEGIYEKLANGCFAQLVTEESFVVPQQFGAYADGKKNDTIAVLRALQYAVDNDLDLKLPQGEYHTKSTIVLDNVDVYCENAKISFHGLDVNVPAIDMKSNVNVYGKLHIWTIDNLKTNHGGRCGMGFGNYGTGEGAYNCYVEDLTISGGIPNANGILITGDSNNLRFDKVTIPKGTKIGRGILLHWGNANDYVVKQPGTMGGLEVVEGADPTKHPHDIYVKQFIAEGIDEKAQYGDAAAFFISAAYNVTVDEIIVDSSRSVLALSAGDCGFMYADEEIREHGMKNIKIGKIKATNLSSMGIYYSIFSSYFGDTNFYGELEIEEVDMSYKNTYSGAGPQFAGISKLRIGTMTLNGLRAQALHFTYHSSDVEVETLNLINCKGQAIYITHKDNEAKCSNFRFKTVNLGEGCGNTTKEAIFSDSVDGLTVDTLKLNGVNYTAIMTLNASCSNVQIGTVTCTNANLSSVFYAKNEVTAANNISFGSITEKTVPLTAGASCVVSTEN